MESLQNEYFLQVCWEHYQRLQQAAERLAFRLPKELEAGDKAQWTDTVFAKLYNTFQEHGVKRKDCRYDLPNNQALLFTQLSDYPFAWGQLIRPDSTQSFPRFTFFRHSDLFPMTSPDHPFINLQHQSLLFHRDSQPIFCTPDWNESILSKFTPTLAGDLYFQPSGPALPLAQLWGEVFASKLLIRVARDKPLLGCFDLENVRMKLLAQVDIEARPCLGIRFLKGRTYERVYGAPEFILRLYDHLRKECIQNKFQVCYRIGHQIGKGNFASVFTADRRIDNKTFAIKIFEKQPLVEDRFEMECVLYELKMMKTIRHPGLLSLEEIFEGENRIYCASKLLLGGQLAEYLNAPGAKLLKSQVSQLCHRMLESLAYLESLDIIHRDLKADNVVLTSPNDFDSPVIVDLGFATHTKDQKKLFTRCGTPGNVAPEVLQDLSYDPKADVYSLGVLLYHAAVGKNPFDAPTYDEMIARNIKGVVDVSPLQGVLEPWLVLIISRMLNPNPKQRPHASEALKEYLHSRTRS